MPIRPRSKKVRKSSAADGQPDIVMIVRKQSGRRKWAGTIRTYSVANIDYIIDLLEQIGKSDALRRLDTMAVLAYADKLCLTGGNFTYDVNDILQPILSSCFC